jgi:hypothetical protein
VHAEAQTRNHSHCKNFFMPFRVFSFCKDSARRAKKQQVLLDCFFRAAAYLRPLGRVVQGERKNNKFYLIVFSEPPPIFALWAE